MTTYKELFGKYVQNYASDPTSTDAEGQIWYNSTSGTFKTALGGYGAWSSGGNLNTSRWEMAGSGIQNTALAIGGKASGSESAATEKYNGTSWTSTGNLNTARRALGAAGTQTATIAFGGYAVPGQSTSTETFNGTSWSPVTSVPTGGYGMVGCGTQTAALAVSGQPSPTSTQVWNGSSWTSGGSLNTGRYSSALVGITTAALIYGGSGPSAATEKYNGTAWTSVNSLNTSRVNLFGFGTQSLAIAAGGSTGPAVTGATESWNGTSWTTVPATLATSRQYGGSAGASQTAGLVFGGTDAPTAANYTMTEAWNITGVSVPVAGSWSSGGALPASKFMATGFGSQTAAIIAGGDSGGSIVGTAFTYNGTSWSPSPSLNTPRAGIMGSSNAPQTAGVVFGGYTTYPNMLTATELWNGTAFTNNPTGLNTARQSGGGAGIQTAAICVGGESPGGATTATELWNGTSWTTSPVSIPSGGPGVRGFGLQTAAIFIGSGSSQSWNGTSFSSAGTQNNPSSNRGVFGTQTAGVAAGVQASPPTGATELWNGSAWTSSSNSLATSRYGLVGFGTQSSGLGSGGYTGTGYSTSTEEWTGPSTTLNYKTLTTS
jgi:hypothetical protein